MAVRQGKQGWGKIRAISEYMGESRSTIRRRCKSGELPYYRLPSGTILIRYADVDAYLAPHRIEAGQSDLDELVETIVDEVLDG